MRTIGISIILVSWGQYSRKQILILLFASWEINLVMNNELSIMYGSLYLTLFLHFKTVWLTFCYFWLHIQHQISDGLHMSESTFGLLREKYYPQLNRIRQCFKFGWSTILTLFLYSLQNSPNRSANQ